MTEATQRACAICVCRHETGNAASPLQCRALPPVQGVARLATFPAVAPDAYCHASFKLDTEAVKAQAEAVAASARLDAQAAATAQAALAYPHLSEKQISALDRIPDDGISKPGGAPSGGNRPAETSAAMPDASAAPKRARRARSADAADALPLDPPA